jgi:hypothetical protein
VDKYRVLGATEEGLKHLKQCSHYTTTFNPNNKNELKIAEFIDSKFEGYKKTEVSTPVIIFKHQSVDN